MSEGSLPRVLIAEASAEARICLVRMLSPRHAVDAFADSDDALDFARRHPPDIILADAALLRAVRGDDALRAIPFIQLFSRAGGEPTTAGEGTPDDWLGVPCAAAEVTARVESHLRLARLRQEVAVREREAEEFRGRVAGALGHLPFAVTIFNPEGQITYVNPARNRILRMPNLPTIGAKALDHWPAFRPDGTPLEPAEYPINRALRGEFTNDLEIEYRGGDGPPRWLRVSGIPVFGPDGTVISAIAVAVEITGEKQAQLQLLKLTETLEQRVQEEINQRLKAEEILRQAQKMQAIGQLTGGVAHDFNNLLQIVLGNLDRLQGELAEAGSLGKDKAARYIENALGGAHRAAHLTQQLLVFARRQPLDPSAVDVNNLVRGMTELFRRTLGDAIAIETVTADELWTAFVDRNQLESALLNLAVNARDAMAAGGRLTIKTANFRLDAARAVHFDHIPPGDYVTVTVSDTGCGIDSRILPQVFEPFFTTKEEGKGTGLGLSQVYGFVTQSGGWVTIASEIGRGTDVTLVLPVRRTPA